MSEKDFEDIIESDESGGYEISIENFSGPLDMLLAMVKQAKIDIKDIFISNITDQYLTFIKQLESLDLERTSAFLEVAATLIEIKSKSLLPRLDDVLPELADEEDEEQKFIRRLEEYKLIKDAAEKMKAVENVDSFYRSPDESVGDYRVVLKQMTIEGLLDALSKLITKVEIKKHEVKPRQIKKDPFTVADKIEFLSKVVSEKKKVSFYELFMEDYTRSEVITTFQALLELMKLQYVLVEQEDTYSEIIISFNESAVERGEALEEAVLEMRDEELREQAEIENSTEIPFEYEQFEGVSYDESADEEEDEEFELSIPFESDEFKH